MCKGSTFNHSGDNGEGDPPVLIPNTEVKPFSADGTWLDTTRESRSSPVTSKEEIVKYCLFFLCSAVRVNCKIKMRLLR